MNTYMGCKMQKENKIYREKEGKNQKETNRCGQYKVYETSAWDTRKNAREILNCQLQVRSAKNCRILLSKARHS